MKKFLKSIFHIDHALVSLFTLLIVGLLVYASFNIYFLSPVKRAITSFSMTSIYYQVMNSDEEKEMSDLITLVDMTELTHRDSLAMLVEQITEMQPRQLGVDIIFEGRKDDIAADAQLTEAFFNCSENTVVAVKLLNYNKKEKSFSSAVHSFFIYDDVPVTEGFTNAMTDEAKVIRNYNISYDLNGKKVYSLPAQIAMAAGVGLDGQPNEHLINFQGVKFPVVRWMDIQKHPELIKDRIVLLGTTQEENDMHYTAIGKMSGLEVLAYSVLSMLEGYDVTEAPMWAVILMAFLAGYVTNVCDYLFRTHSKKSKNFFLVFIRESNLYLRFVYFLLMVIVTWITFFLYVKEHFHLNSILALSTIILIAEGRLMLKGLVAALTNTFHWKWLANSLYAPEQSKQRKEIASPEEAPEEEILIEQNL